MSGLAMRQHPRLDVKVPIEVHAEPWSGPREFTTLDISEGGAFLLSHAAEPLGTQLRCVIDMGEGEAPLHLKAEVVRIVGGDTATAHGGRPGMGVRFLDVDETTAGGLAALIAAIAAVAQEMSSSPEPAPRVPGERLPQEQLRDHAAHCEAALREERWSTAFKHAQVLFEDAPDNPKYRLFYHMSAGLSLVASRPKDARKHLAQALAIDPYHQQCVEAMRRIGEPRQRQTVEATRIPFWKSLFSKK